MTKKFSLGILVFTAITGYASFIFSTIQTQTAIKALTQENNIKSYNIVKEAYESIYYNNQLNLTVKKLQKQERIINDDNLLKITDIGEEIGQSFCRGRLFRIDIKDQLMKTFETICNSAQILKEYKEEKNGLAMICYELHPTSDFAQTLKTENLKNCKFLDNDNEISKLR